MEANRRRKTPKDLILRLPANRSVQLEHRRSSEMERRVSWGNFQFRCYLSQSVHSQSARESIAWSYAGPWHQLSSITRQLAIHWLHIVSQVPGAVAFAVNRIGPGA
jgi:uncharacterized protein (DUF427 family)